MSLKCIGIQSGLSGILEDEGGGGGGGGAAAAAAAAGGGVCRG